MGKKSSLPEEKTEWPNWYDIVTLRMQTWTPDKSRVRRGQPNIWETSQVYTWDSGELHHESLSEWNVTWRT